MDSQSKPADPAPQCPVCHCEQEGGVAGEWCLACVVSELFRRLRDGR